MNTLNISHICRFTNLSIVELLPNPPEDRVRQDEVRAHQGRVELPKRGVFGIIRGLLLLKNKILSESRTPDLP